MIRRHYSLAELGQVLQLSQETLRQYMRAGLLTPVETVDGVPHFDFEQVLSARAIGDLVKNGVSLGRIRKSLEQLQKWFDSTQPLAQLAAFEPGGELLVRLEQGQLAGASGQLHLDFPREHPLARDRSRHGEEGPEVRGPAEQAKSEKQNARSESAEDWFAHGCEQEAAGRLAEAEESYRRALAEGGPDAMICFNLANVLFALDKKEAAIERYRQVLEIDRAFAGAWSNLGTALAEAGANEQAIACFQQALEKDPHCQDACFNLADLLDQLDKPREACPYWRAYLRTDSKSEWAAHARRRLYLAGLEKS